MRTVLLALTFLVLSACGGIQTRTDRSGPRHPPRSIDCQIELFDSMPEGYVEIGVIEVTYTSPDRVITNPKAFENHIRPYVCEMGGDSAVAARGASGFDSATVVVHGRPL